MSSKQLTLDDLPTHAPDEPERAPTPTVEHNPKPDIGDVPNFNRERGRERTQLGAALGDLTERAHDYEPTRQRARQASDEQKLGEDR